ncbi:hypothetical protein UPYG_G00002170 [Umbra pygmaea]|uniref:Uncharacterized protein n=1 Tax=Umbra pygmaea TaxID=75934 RepID=A0ABD0XJ59_UMBPY
MVIFIFSSFMFSLAVLRPWDLLGGLYTSTHCSIARPSTYSEASYWKIWCKAEPEGLQRTSCQPVPECKRCSGRDRVCRISCGPGKRSEQEQEADIIVSVEEKVGLSGGASSGRRGEAASSTTSARSSCI